MVEAGALESRRAGPGEETDRPSFPELTSDWMADEQASQPGVTVLRDVTSKRGKTDRFENLEKLESNSSTTTEFRFS